MPSWSIEMFYNVYMFDFSCSFAGVCKGAPTGSGTSGTNQGCCVDQQGSIGHQVVSVPGVPGPLPSEQNPPPPQRPGFVDPNLYPAGVGDPNRFTPGAGNQGQSVPVDPGAGGSTFETPLIEDVQPVNDGVPPFLYPGAPVVEQQHFDPFAEETWYQYPYGVGYDGSDGTHHAGIPRGSQPVVDPLPDQNCCEDGQISQVGNGLSNPIPGNSPYPGSHGSSNPNPFGGQTPYGNPHPYPQGQPVSVDFPQQPLPGTGSTSGQLFTPQNPGGNGPVVEMEVDQPVRTVHTGDENPRLYHATAGGGGGGAQNVMVPFLAGDNLPGQVEESTPREVK